MPIISQFYGVYISMFWREHNPPHLHAAYQGIEAIYDIKKASRTKQQFSVLFKSGFSEAKIVD